MNQTSMSSECGDDNGVNNDLVVSLLPTRNYTKIWRRTYYIGILISLKKSTTSSGSSESPLPSPPSSSAQYTPLPPSEPPAPATARTSSSKSFVGIDIASDAEEEKAEDVFMRIERIVKEKDLTSLLELGGVDRVCSLLGQQRQHSEEGITYDGNHEVLESIVPLHGTSFSSFFMNSCKRSRFIIPMLLFSAVLSFAVEIKQEGPRYGWHDGVAMLVAISLMVVVPSIANFWRQRTMMKLSKRKGKLKFTVQRGEEGPLNVAISDIFVGDIVSLKIGDEVPAEGLFLDGENFVLDKARSKSDREGNPFLIGGSKVIDGQGKMVVTSVGNKRNLADIQNSMSCYPERRGLLDGRIEKPISYIDNFSLFVFVLVGAVVLIRLICKKDGDSGGLPDLKGKVSVGLVMEILERTILRPQGKISILTGLVTAAILCIQHGMPLMVAISLGCQVEKEVSEDAVLNDLSACTTLGQVSVICVDASGGLISKPMEVTGIWMGKKDISMDISKVEGSEVNQVVRDKLQQGVGLSVLVPELALSPMSRSLIYWGEATWGMNIESLTEEFTILKHSKLNIDKEGSGVLVRKVGDNEQDLHLHWNGAASTILDMCSQYYDSKGECHDMVENQKSKFEQVIKEMEDSGLKPIAFAHKKAQVQELEQDELILLGLIGLQQTCQGSIKMAFKYLRNAGIKIKLVSEDDIMVVKGIACELEEPEDGILLEGKEFQDLNGSGRLDKVDLAHIMGSFTPEDMLLMVKCLQGKGHVVAFVETRMTTSLASVLQVADVGIVLDSLSTIADRESSGIIIKRWAALEPIVRDGRGIYSNIQKFIQLQIIFGISGSLITFITTIFTGGSPLTGFQLIWVNMLMCMLGGLMMGMKFNNDIQPSHRNQSIITKEIWKSIVIQVSYQISVSMILEFGGHISDKEKVNRKTMIFNTFLLCQLFNLLNTMALLKKEVLKVVLRSYCFLVALALSLLMQVLVIEYANGLANCTRLNARHWAICVLVGVFSCVFDWALKSLLDVLSTNSASASESNGYSNTSHWIYLTWGFPFLMLFSFPVIIFSQMGHIFPYSG